MQAVVYCRVSSQEQVKNLSLETQMQACQDYCRANGLTVVKTFVERGESARTTDRTELQRLLTYCRKRRGQIHCLVVYMLDRFARNQYDHHALKAYLMKLGITLRAVAQPIDDSSTGQLMEGILAAFSEFDNNLRRDRTVTGMKASLERGHWVFPTPLGYRRELAAGGKRTLVLDPEKAPLVKKAFEMAASGLYEVPEILREMRALGLTGKRGKPISSNTLHNLLHNPIYHGRVRVPKWNIDAQASFPPLISEETFGQAQVHLSGKRPPVSAYQRNHPDFPLRRFIRCGICKRPLTGAWTRGRSQTYGYYECKSCQGTRQRKESLEQAFVDLLDRLRPTDKVMKLMRAAVLDRWSDQKKETVARRRAIEAKVGNIETRKEKLIDAYIYESAVDKETYQRHLARLEEELTLTELDLYDTKIDEFDIKGTLAFAEHLVSDASRLWLEADLDQRQRLQKLFFPAGLDWSYGEFRTAVTCPYFKSLDENLEVEKELVARTGFEPVLPA